MVACEEEIILDLDSVEPELVVEGIVAQPPFPSYVILSETEDFYEFNGGKPVTDAKVVLTSDGGQTDILTPDENGVYHVDTTFDIMPGREYSLSVEWKDKACEAHAVLPGRVEIDSLDSRTSDFAPPGEENVAVVYVYFLDDASQKDYYRFVFYVNGEPYEDSYGFIIIDDEIFNGEIFSFPVYLFGVVPGDTVVAELRHITKEMFDYYTTLDNITTSGGPKGSATPYNPKSNIEGGALGYFGAYSADTGTVIIQKVHY